MKIKYFNTDRKNVAYSEFGHGEALLVLAGGPGLHASYLMPVIGELSRSCRVVVLHQHGTLPRNDQQSEGINLRGYIQDIEDLRKNLHIERWMVMGHSWGGLLASAYAAHHGEFVQKLVLINSAGLHHSIFGQLFDNILQRLSGVEYQQCVELATQLQSPEGTKLATRFFQAAMPAYFYDKQKAREFANTIDDEFLTFNTFGLMMHDVTSAEIDLREDAKYFTKPVLSIRARQDIVGFQAYYDLQFFYPNIESAIIEQAGHYCWLEQPDIFYKTIGSFINKT